MRRRILFLTISNQHGASSRYRVYQYLPALQAAGFDVEIVPPSHRGTHLTRPLRRLREQSRLLAKANQADLLFIQKRLFSIGFLDRLLRLGKPLIFDFDDAIFTSPSGDWSAVTRARVGARLSAVLRSASLTIAGNRYLAEFAGSHGCNVEILPTAIDLDRYRTKPPSCCQQLTLGWIGNHVNQRYLDLLRRPLVAISAKVPTLRLVVVSDRNYRLDGAVVENRRWSEQTEVEDLCSFDIGLMPLQANAWTLGKCALKALQYMAVGIPAVCSAVGANCEIVDDGVDGYLCRSESDWSRAIQRLAFDRSLRAAMGAKGRTKVERSYSTATTAARLLALLERLA